MSFRTRVQTGAALVVAAVLAASLTSVAPPASARVETGSATAARAAATAPTCGVTTYYKADGTKWKCVFSDDFTGTALNKAKWYVMTSAGFNFGDRADCFVPGNVTVSNGNLNLIAKRVTSDIRCHKGKGTFRTRYSSGMVSTYQRWSQAYGRFEFRAKFPYTTQRGLQTSTWLWPKGATGAAWPISGEIDVAEWYSQYPDRVIPFLHYGSLLTGGATNNNCLVNRVQDWHTYVLEWAPKALKISYDGKTCLVKNGVGAPFNKDYFMAMFHGFGLKKNVPTASTPGYSVAQYAWVRVWA